MQKIEVYLTQSLINDDLFLKDKNVVVVDVLRATTTITVALVNGAKEIIPTEAVSTAARISKGFGNSLLCGERNGKIVEGFNLGNSPYEYKTDVIKDKSLIFSTTNGTVAITKSKLAKTSALASFINLSKVVEHLKGLEGNIIIVCSGKLNNFCIEDTVCAGTIIHKLLSDESNGTRYELDDAAFACLKLGVNLVTKSKVLLGEMVLDMLKNSDHGKFLISLGFEEDLKLCSKIDSYQYLPVYNNGKIKLPEKIESETTQLSQMKKIKISK